VKCNGKLSKSYKIQSGGFKLGAIPEFLKRKPKPGTRAKFQLDIRNHIQKLVNTGGYQEGIYRGIIVNNPTRINQLNSEIEVLKQKIQIESNSKDIRKRQQILPDNNAKPTLEKLVAYRNHLTGLKEKFSQGKMSKDNKNQFLQKQYNLMKIWKNSLDPQNTQSPSSSTVKMHVYKDQFGRTKYYFTDMKNPI
jgi:hypothetical protein